MNSSNKIISTNPWLIAFVVSIATFMEVLDTTITNVSLSHISGSLGASYDESTWVLTSYLVANGIVIPLSGWLSSLIGRKNYFLICISCFTIASFACGAATSLPMLVLFRLIQGAAGGGLQPVQQAIILDAFPPEKRAAAFGFTSITMILAPILGPTLGGWITDSYSWRWIFYINVPVGILAFILVNRFVYDSVAKSINRNIDYIGVSLIALGLGSLQIVLDKGQQEDWLESKLIITFMFISFICLITAVYWLLNRKNAIINLSLLKDKSFRMSCFMIFTVGFFLYSSSMIIPLMAQTQLGYTSTLSGMVISPGGVVVIMIIPFMSKILSIFRVKHVIILGFFLASLGLFYSTHVSPAMDYNSLVWTRVAQVVCLPLLFVPVSTLAYTNIAKDQNNKASALYSMARNLGGSIGIAVTTTFIARNQQKHQAYLSENFMNFDTFTQENLNVISNTLITYGADTTAANQMAVAQLYQKMLSQTTFLAFQDAYMLLTGLAIIALVFACFIPNNKPNSNPVIMDH